MGLDRRDVLTLASATVATGVVASSPLVRAATPARIKAVARLYYV